jgi:hypothetical protein
MKKDNDLLIFSDRHPAFFHTHIPNNALLIFNSQSQQVFHYQFEIEKGEFFQVKPVLQNSIRVFMNFGEKERVLHGDVLRSAIKAYHISIHHKELSASHSLFQFE